jgi:hypothetical protein
MVMPSISAVACKIFRHGRRVLERLAEEKLVLCSDQDDSDQVSLSLQRLECLRLRARRARRHG